MGPGAQLDAQIADLQARLASPPLASLSGGDAARLIYGRDKDGSLLPYMLLPDGQFFRLVGRPLPWTVAADNGDAIRLTWTPGHRLKQDPAYKGRMRWDGFEDRWGVGETRRLRSRITIGEGCIPLYAGGWLNLVEIHAYPSPGDADVGGPFGATIERSGDGNSYLRCFEKPVYNFKGGKVQLTEPPRAMIGRQLKVDEGDTVDIDVTARTGPEGLLRVVLNGSVLIDRFGPFGVRSEEDDPATYREHYWATGIYLDARADAGGTPRRDTVRLSGVWSGG